MTYSEYERLLFDRRDHGVLLVTMNRPEKYNAFDREMLRELADIVRGVTDSAKCRVVATRDCSCRRSIGT